MIFIECLHFWEKTFKLIGIARILEIHIDFTEYTKPFD